MPDLKISSGQYSDKIYVCTFSALIVKLTTVHLFHIRDSRIDRLRDNQLELLTEYHRYWVSDKHCYLNRGIRISAYLYQMLTGKLPFGTEVAKAQNKVAKKRLRYQSVLSDELEISA